jgi:hypothetical protein
MFFEKSPDTKLPSEIETTTIPSQATSFPGTAKCRLPRPCSVQFHFFSIGAFWLTCYAHVLTSEEGCWVRTRLLCALIGGHGFFPVPEIQIIMCCIKQQVPWFLITLS